MSAVAEAVHAHLLATQTVTDMRRADCMGCGECCGRFLPLTVADRIRLEGYVRTHGVVPREEPHGFIDMTCPYLDESRECMVYEARPEVCRRYSWRLHAAGKLKPWKGLLSAAETDMREFAEATTEGESRG